MSCVILSLGDIEPPLEPLSHTSHSTSTPPAGGKCILYGTYNVGNRSFHTPSPKNRKDLDESWCVWHAMVLITRTKFELHTPCT